MSQKIAVGRYFRVAELASMLSVNRSTIWRWVKEDPNFPNPIKLGPKVTVWDGCQIQDWLQSRGGVKVKAIIE